MFKIFKSLLFLLYSIVLFAISFLGCKSNDYDGYTLKENGIYFKLLKFNDSKNRVKIGSVVTFHISYSTPDDSVFFEAVRKIKIDKPSYKGSIEECFLMLNEGDSASFLIAADPFFEKTLESSLPHFFPKNSYIKINISVISVKSAEEFEKEKKEFLAWIEDFGEYEKAILKKYLQKLNISYSPYDTSIYKILVFQGNNKYVQYGDTVVLHFEGYFLNGKIFDSTRKRNEAFSFVIGTEWQVIKGLEKAILTMCEKEKSIFIIPSKLAFGKTGSSSGIIPPYTSVVFEVELLEVKKSIPL
jgi:peptidylprolyl isomerase